MTTRDDQDRTPDDVDTAGTPPTRDTDRTLAPVEGDRDLASPADAAVDTGQDTAGDWLVAPGTEVVDAEGTLVGRVDDIQDGHLVVRKGRFFVNDYYIPFAAIGSHDDTTIYLAVIADDHAVQIWHQRPPERGQGGAADTAHAEVDAETRMEFLTDREGNVHVPVLQEDLIASRRPVVRGRVRIETQISEHEQTLEVPVTEERVRIQRRTMQRDANGTDIVVDGGTFEVPFYGEDVDLEKRVRVIEEIIITREAVETVRRVRGTIRREDVQVDDSGAPHADDAAVVPGDDGPVPLGEGQPERRDRR